MEIYELPGLFESDPSFLPFSEGKAGIKFYSSTADTFRANVLLTTNLLIFVLEGTKVIYPNTGKVTLHLFQGALLPRGSYLMSEHRSKQEHYRAILFFFDNDMAKPHFVSNGRAHNSLFQSLLTFRNHPLLEGFLHSLEAYPELIDPAQHEHLLHLKFGELFSILTIIRPELPQCFRKQTQREVTNLKHLLESHATENISLEQLAFLSGCSLSTFKRRALQLLGRPAKTWIIQRRLEIARQLLQSTRKSVAEIGDEIGYENTSHFIKQFQKQYGATPSTFRKEPNPA